MTTHLGDVYAYAFVLCLPFIVRLVGTERIRHRLQPRIEPLATRLWQQVVEPHQWETDEQILRRVAFERVDRLRGSTERVRRQMLDDAWMTGTRQVGNRQAYARLVLDLRDAELAAAAYGEVEVVETPAAPTPAKMTVWVSYDKPVSSTGIETLELGPRGRWF